MTTEDALQALRDWVAAATGLSDARVIIAPSNAQRPDMPYATVSRFASTMSIGVDSREPGPTDVSGAATLVIAGERQALSDVQFYGGVNEAAGDYCELLRQGLSDPLLQISSRESDLVIGDVGPTRALDQLVDTGYETRAVVEVTVRFHIEKTKIGAAAGGTIEHVTVTGTAGDIAVEVTADYP